MSLIIILLRNYKIPVYRTKKIDIYGIGSACIMIKKMVKTGVYAAILILTLAFVGCQNRNSKINPKRAADNDINSEFVYTQNDLKEPMELEMSTDGIVTLEVENLAKPDHTLPEEKSSFLSVLAKEDTDIFVQYTYNTYGKEGALLCCDLKENNEMETKLEPLFSTYLSQFSEEHYKDTWLTTGLFLKKGENIFYLNGKDQTFPYCMALKITFLESEKIEKVILYPEEVSSSDK